MVTIEEFNSCIWNFYKENSRDLPWRESEQNGSFDPYKILVSELMLQQTQVSRVVPKYNSWIKTFPDIQILAHASLTSVLTAWSGLGYNRRAKYLHDSAKQILQLGYFPNSVNKLTLLPGVGRNTAGAIAAYAFNEPEVFIETNVRTVFLYEFFKNESNVTDREIAALVQKTVDKNNPREWYWAIMDYGSYLKKSHGNNIKNSKHYKAQTKFIGSKRQIRGQIIKALSKGKLKFESLEEQIGDKRFQQAISELETEGLVMRTSSYYQLPI